MLNGEDMDIIAIHSVNLMVATKPLSHWKNLSRRGKRGSIRKRGIQLFEVIQVYFD